jgi:hypothetical protein
MKARGSRAEVMHGTARRTSGGLRKQHLKYNKRGKIVSKRASARAKKENRLVKAGYKTKKGTFGSFKNGTRVSRRRSKRRSRRRSKRRSRRRQQGGLVTKDSSRGRWNVKPGKAELASFGVVETMNPLSQVAATTFKVPKEASNGRRRGGIHKELGAELASLGVNLGEEEVAATKKTTTFDVPNEEEGGEAEAVLYDPCPTDCKSGDHASADPAKSEKCGDCPQFVEFPKAEFTEDADGERRLRGTKMKRPANFVDIVNVDAKEKIRFEWPGDIWWYNQKYKCVKDPVSKDNVPTYFHDDACGGKNAQSGTIGWMMSNDTPPQYAAIRWIGGEEGMNEWASKWIEYNQDTMMHFDEINNAVERTAAARHAHSR